MSHGERYVSTGAMARALGCTPRTVRDYCEGGLFPGSTRLPGPRADWRIPGKFYLQALRQQEAVKQEG